MDTSQKQNKGIELHAMRDTMSCPPPALVTCYLLLGPVRTFSAASAAVRRCRSATAAFDRVAPLRRLPAQGARAQLFRRHHRESATAARDWSWDRSDRATSTAWS